MAGQASEVDLSWLDSSKPSDLSPDGTTVLITEDGVGTGGRPAVYLRTTDGAQAVRIGEGYGIALSPDKKWVLARREEAGRRTFVLMPTGPGQTRPLAYEGLDVSWGSFTPDGRRIVFDAVAGGQPSRLYVADLAGGQPRPLGPPNVRHPTFTNAVSPDGRFAIGFRDGKLALLPLEGSDTPRELSGLGVGLNRAHWGADSRSLYLAERAGRGRHKVDLYDIETGARRTWKEIPVPDSLARTITRVTPDGRAYVYSGITVSSELYLVEGLH